MVQFRPWAFLFFFVILGLYGLWAQAGYRQSLVGPELKPGPNVTPTRRKSPTKDISKGEALDVAVANPYEVVKRVTSGTEPPSSTLILSSDMVRRERAADYLVDAFWGTKGSSRSSRAIGLTRIDGASLTVESIAKLKEDMSGLFLFANRRVYLVSNIHDMSTSTQEPLMALVEKAYPKTHLIFTGMPLNKANPLRAYHGKKETLIEFPELEGAELERWVDKDLRRNGLKEIMPGVVSQLIAVAEDNLDELARLSTHLALYCDKDSVCAADVEAIFGHRISLKDFELVEAVVQGKLARAQYLVRTLILDEGKNPLSVHGLLSKMFCNYLAVKLLVEHGCSFEDIGKKLSSQAWAVKKQADVAKGYSRKSLQKCLEILLSADGKLKGKSLGPEVVLDNLVVKLVQMHA